jgi:aspartate racemase
MKKIKAIGLIGGMSWESTVEYYKIINQSVNLKLGGVHSCECLMYSFDFALIERLQHMGKWDQLTGLMISAAKRLETAGAKIILICTNTMHKMADEVEQNINVNVLHIADATGEVIKKMMIKKVGLLGTKFTMEQDFYKKRIEEEFNIEVIIPESGERQIVHDIIYKELVIGKISQSSKQIYVNIINNLKSSGAEGVILGCTEIPLLVKQVDCDLPLFDTTTIHAKAAVDLAFVN